MTKAACVVVGVLVVGAALADDTVVLRSGKSVSCRVESLTTGSSDDGVRLSSDDGVRLEWR
jgi:hypothetical protein